MKNTILIGIFSLFTLTSFSQNNVEVREKNFNLDSKKVAISGYDPVSYFTEEAPLKGKKEFNHTYNGITYHFSTLQNKEVFVRYADKYEPQYGGWCAYAMSGEKPSKVSVNPKTYKIVDNKLYLFYNKLNVNTLKKWNEENETKLKKNADKNWNTFISK